MGLEEEDYQMPNLGCEEVKGMFPFLHVFPMKRTPYPGI